MPVTMTSADNREEMTSQSRVRVPRTNNLAMGNGLPAWTSRQIINVLGGRLQLC